MNQKVIKRLSGPLAALALAFAAAACAKFILHSEIIGLLGMVACFGCIFWLLFLMWKLQSEWKEQERKLLEDVSEYVFMTYGSSFVCSRVPSGIRDEKYPRCEIYGPLQIEGAFDAKPFRFRVISARERDQEEGRTRFNFFFEGYTLEWDYDGVSYRQKTYIPHKGIDDFRIEEVMEMIRNYV